MKNRKEMFLKQRFNIIYFIFALWGIFIFREFWQQSQQVATIPYREFQSLLKSNQVSEVVVSENYLRGKLKEPRADKTFRPPKFYGDISFVKLYGFMRGIYEGIQDIQPGI